MINHDILLNKMVGMVPAHLVRWMAAFLLVRKQRVKIGDAVSKLWYPNRGVPQWTLSGPKHFLFHINDLQRLVLFINMLTTALYLKYATKTWYLLSRILLTLLSNSPVIMTCVSIRLRPKRWLYIYMFQKRQNICRFSAIYLYEWKLY